MNGWKPGTFGATGVASITNIQGRLFGSRVTS